MPLSSVRVPFDQIATTAFELLQSDTAGRRCGAEGNADPHPTRIHPTTVRRSPPYRPTVGPGGAVLVPQQPTLMSHVPPLSRPVGMSTSKSTPAYRPDARPRRRRRLRGSDGGRPAGGQGEGARRGHRGQSASGIRQPTPDAPRRHRTSDPLAEPAEPAGLGRRLRAGVRHRARCRCGPRRPSRAPTGIRTISFDRVILATGSTTERAPDPGRRARLRPRRHRRGAHASRRVRRWLREGPTVNRRRRRADRSRDGRRDRREPAGPERPPRHVR